MKIQEILFLSCAVIMAALAAISPVRAETVIKIGGTGDGLGLMKIAAEAYAKLHPDIKIDVLPSLGTGGGIKALAKGALDIGLTGRPLSADERKLDIKQIAYAKLPFIFIVNEEVTIADVKTRDILDIYGGKKLTWPDGRRLRLVLRPESDSDSDMLRTIAPEMAGILKTALSRSGMILAVTSQDSAESVEKTPGAFGTSTLSLIITENRRVKIISFNGHKPVARGSAIKSYPLLKNLSILTRTRPDEQVKQFVDYLFSPAGRNILERSGNVPTDHK